MFKENMSLKKEQKEKDYSWRSLYLLLFHSHVTCSLKPLKVLNIKISSASLVCIELRSALLFEHCAQLQYDFLAYIKQDKRQSCPGG
jgi:hypothetical protein